MQTSPDAFRTISEVADDLSIPAHVLRFWETKFHQISPVKRGGGRRYYRPDDVRLLRGIQRLLHGDGLTIKGAQKLLRDRGIRHVVGLGDTESAVVETMAEPVAMPATKPNGTPAPSTRLNGEQPQDLPTIYAKLLALRARVAEAADRDTDSL